ncbi:mitochondrial carrier domain-containing protein, partial [Ochromonadaceae sp. CCMP2298]
MLAVMIRFRFLSLILVWIIVALDASTSSDTKRFDVRNMFAGGLAGGMSNAIIYPIDTIKTVKQIASSKTDAAARLSKIFSPEGFVKLYSGFIPAVVGAIPSSAIYFGTYETMKQFLSTREKKLHRPFIHMISAASGNIASSFVFVPKETIKQQLQAIKMGSVEWAYSSDVNFITVSRNIIRTNGIKGFFPSYRATLLRNVASAMVRFTVYEELKLAIGQHLDKQYESLG